ncbi:MAG: hypothetical protein QY317_16315 [Candidatus Jettenia caeni]|nr:MAG: hypothetical protein QY317_16315 [Candidatus Jettenia caeni]
MKIYYKSNTDSHCPLLWAWEESKNKNVWGGAKSIAEIERRAQRMFSNEAIELVAL